jgi:hypothetical protein
VFHCVLHLSSCSFFSVCPLSIHFGSPSLDLVVCISRALVARGLVLVVLVFRSFSLLRYRLHLCLHSVREQDAPSLRPLKRTTTTTTFSSFTFRNADLNRFSLNSIKCLFVPSLASTAFQLSSEEFKTFHLTNAFLCVGNLAFKRRPTNSW